MPKKIHVDPDALSDNVSPIPSPDRGRPANANAILDPIGFQLSIRNEGGGSSRFSYIGDSSFQSVWVEGQYVDVKAAKKRTVTGSGASEIFGIHGKGKVDIHAGDGNDILYVYSKQASVNADMGAGDDCAFGSINADTIDGGYGDDILFGGRGNDTLIGGIGSNYLNGGAGNDWLIDNSIDSDTLVGGSGADTFDFSRNVIPSIFEITENNLIEDFDSSDTIRLKSQFQGSVSFSNVNGLVQIDAGANNYWLHIRLANVEYSATNINAIKNQIQFVDFDPLPVVNPFARQPLLAVSGS